MWWSKIKSIFPVIFLVASLVFALFAVLQRTNLLSWADVIQPALTHSFGIRQGKNGGEFYNLKTGSSFILRGNNYVRLAEINDPFVGKTVYHSTFDPGLYSANNSEAALQQMKLSQYNTVRVFISDAAVGSNSGINTAYVQNVVDFLQRAKNNNISVILTFPYIPKTGGYYSAISDPQNFEGMNWHYLTTEAVDAKKRYLKDFISKLLELHAPMDSIFSYEIDNEVYFQENAKPISMKSGLVKTANGQTYDMSKPDQKQQMMDAGLVYWINEIKKAVISIDPTALVGVGFFSPNAVTGSDPRIIRTYWAIANPAIGGSSADYIDLHIYPTKETTANDLSAFEITKSNKPIIIGEFGAYRSKYASASIASTALRDFQIEACNKYGFKGWLAWTWDTSEQPELYSVTEFKGAINGYLAPLVRQNPCTK